MAADSLKGHLIGLDSRSLIGNLLIPISVHRDAGLQFRMMLHIVFHALEGAGSLFLNRSHKLDVSLGLDLRCVESPDGGENHRAASGIVHDSRTFDKSVLPDDLQLGVQIKHCVHVGLHQNRLSAAGSLPDSHTVSVFVNMAICQTFFLKHLQEPGRLLLLMIGGGRNQSQLNLLLHNILVILLHKGQSLLNLFISRQLLKALPYFFRNLIFHLRYLLL